jgi:hypothetical protein
MVEFQIGEVQYRSGKLDTFKQLHVSRKIAPLVPKILPAFVSIALAKKRLNAKDATIGDALEDVKQVSSDDVDLIAKAIGPVMDLVAEMSEQDVEYVFSNCLAVVQRKQGRDWVHVWRNEALMFDDIDLPTMTQITMKVVWDNLGPFISGLLAKSATGSPAETMA